MKRHIFPPFFLSVLLIFGSASAVNKVFVIREYQSLSNALECAIVADSNDWDCTISIPYRYSEEVVRGTSKHLPIFFEFSTQRFIDDNLQYIEYNLENATKFAQSYLRRYAKIHSTIFSSLLLRENSGKYCVFNAAYIDNSGSGSIALYVQPVTENVCYCMFVQINESKLSEQLEDESRQALFQESYNLVTPLCSE